MNNLARSKSEVGQGCKSIYAYQFEVIFYLPIRRPIMLEYCNEPNKGLVIEMNQSLDFQFK